MAASSVIVIPDSDSEAGSDIVFVDPLDFRAPAAENLPPGVFVDVSSQTIEDRTPRPNQRPTVDTNSPIEVFNTPDSTPGRSAAGPATIHHANGTIQVSLLEAGPSKEKRKFEDFESQQEEITVSQRRSGRVPANDRPDYRLRKEKMSKGRGKKWTSKGQSKAKAASIDAPIIPPGLLQPRLVKAENGATPPPPSPMTPLPDSPVSLPPRTEVSTEPTVEVRNAGSRGRGLYALRHFSAGDVIMGEIPILTARRSAPPEVLLGKLLNLTPKQTLAIWQLEGSGGYQPLLQGLLDANGIPCVGDDECDDEVEVEMGIFDVLSRINHSCAPNAGWYWSATRKEMRTYPPHYLALTPVLVAYQAVQAGEELLACYEQDTSFKPRRERRKAISRIVGFKCACTVCSAPPDQVAASDRNRQRLADLSRGWDENVEVNQLVAQRDVLVRLCEAADLAHRVSSTLVVIDVKGKAHTASRDYLPQHVLRPRRTGHRGWCGGQASGTQGI